MSMALQLRECCGELIHYDSYLWFGSNVPPWYIMISHACNIMIPSPVDALSSYLFSMTSPTSWRSHAWLVIFSQLPIDIKMLIKSVSWYLIFSSENVLLKEATGTQMWKWYLSIKCFKCIVFQPIWLLSELLVIHIIVLVESSKPVLSHWML